MTPYPFSKTLKQSDVTRGVISLATNNNSKLLLPMEGVLSDHILISDHLLITPMNCPPPTLPQPYPCPLYMTTHALSTLDHVSVQKVNTSEIVPENLCTKLINSLLNPHAKVFVFKGGGGGCMKRITSPTGPAPRVKIWEIMSSACLLSHISRILHV